MAQELADALRSTIDDELPNLRALSEECAAMPRGEGKWCPKEELGHLIDSASNNQQRFVRAAIGPEFRGPSYQQNEWVRVHGYRELPWEMLVEFWYRYNLLLAEVVQRIPDDRLDAQCFIADYAPWSLALLIDDYILHMRHHIDLMLRRPVVTQYGRT